MFLAENPPPKKVEKDWDYIPGLLIGRFDGVADTWNMTNTQPREEETIEKAKEADTAHAPCCTESGADSEAFLRGELLHD